MKAQIRISDHFTYGRLLRFTRPCIVMMIVTSVYSIVDGFFISNFVGKEAFAGANLVWPVLMAFSSFGYMIGTGGSALVAKTMGEGEQDRANQIFTMLVGVLAIVGCIAAAVGFLLMPSIVRLLGATPALMNHSITYGRIVLLSGPFFMLQAAYQSLLVTAEKAKMGLAMSVTAGVMNVVMDFLLVYCFPLGIVGAALATAASQLVGGLVPTLYFFLPNHSRLKLVRFRMDWRSLGKACGNGSSEMLSTLSSSLVGMLYNLQLLRLAGEDGLAAYGVIMYVSFIFVAVFFGYAVGTGPVVGFHYGAQNWEEIRSLLKKSLVITGCFALVMTAAAQLGARPLAQLYVGYDPALAQLTARGMSLYCTAFLLSGFNIFASAFFTGLNNGLVSALISSLRTLVLQILSIFLLPMVLGVNGIWLALALAEAGTLLFSLTMLAVHRKTYHY